MINTIEANPNWILPKYQCSNLESVFTKQKPGLEIDSHLDSEATLIKHTLNKDT